MSLASSKIGYCGPGKYILAAFFVFAAPLFTAIPVMASSNLHEKITISDKKSAIPLKRVIRKIRKNYGGRLLRIKLEKEEIGGRLVLVYEAKVLVSDGRVLKLYYNAKNLKLLKRKGSYKKRRAPKIFSFWKNFIQNNHEGKNQDNTGSGIGGDNNDNSGHDNNGGHDGNSNDNDSNDNDDD